MVSSLAGSDGPQAAVIHCAGGKIGNFGEDSRQGKKSGESLNNDRGPNVSETEDQLLAQAASGERGAQSALFETYRTAAYAVAMRITGRREDALDVVQDAFIKVFAQLRQRKSGSSFRAWLLRIVANQAIDLTRSRRVRRTISIHQHRDDEGGSAPELPARDERSNADDSELRRRLENAIQSLPIEQRAAFSLYASGALSYGEIATILDVPLGTVMSRLHHARKKLHGLLADLAPRTARRDEP